MGVNGRTSRIKKTEPSQFFFKIGVYYDEIEARLSAFHFKTAAAMEQHAVYERVMCTGLGDRMGMLLALAAVARAYNLTSVTMRWCTDPMHALRVNPLFSHYVPGWTGFDYTLEALHAHLHLPPEVRFTLDKDARTPHGSVRLIDHGSDRVPPTQGLPFLPWFGHEIFAIVGRRTRITRAQFEAAYATATDEFMERKVNYDEAAPVFDVVVHLRAFDANTWSGHDRDALGHYCTRAALTRITERLPNVSVAVISHNITWARALLGRTLRKKRLLLTPSYDWEDFNTLLAARRGIVQHGSEGWSAFSSVPALARRLPLLNTYTGPSEHRMDFFARFGPLPEHWHRCSDMDAFIARLV
jgi:hypothetical protein